ncbi:MAG: cytochrome c oxidase assembly protein, partial [Rhodospirillaceae bacterium]|nr:cytochrome c oxidase assembly protein [Rhodospirillaceae bacterium]
MQRRKGMTVIGLLAILGFMGTLTAYSVELYEIFCRV